MEISRIKQIMDLVQHDPLFQYNDDAHSYHYGWQKLNGATGWIHHNFVEPFDEQYWSKKKAKQLDMTQQEVLDMWEDKRNKASILGNTVHNWIEDYINGKNPSLPSSPSGAWAMLHQWIEWWMGVRDTRKNLIQEVRLHGLPLFLNSGTADDPYWCKIRNGVVVNDWKTNEKFTTDEDYAFNRLKYPFHGFDDNKLNIYSIQISLYRLMLEAQGIPTVAGEITWIPRTGAPVVFGAKDLRHELKQYLRVA